MKRKGPTKAQMARAKSVLDLAKEIVDPALPERMSTESYRDLLLYMAENLESLSDLQVKRITFRLQSLKQRGSRKSK